MITLAVMLMYLRAVCLAYRKAYKASKRAPAPTPIPAPAPAVNTENNLTAIDYLRLTIQDQGGQIESLRAALKDAFSRTDAARGELASCEKSLLIATTELKKRTAAQTDQQRWMMHWKAQVDAVHARERQVVRAEKSLAKLSARHEDLRQDERNIRYRVTRLYRDIKKKRRLHDDIASKVQELAAEGKTWNLIEENKKLVSDINDLEATKEKLSGAIQRMNKEKKAKAKEHAETLEDVWEQHELSLAEVEVKKTVQYQKALVHNQQVAQTLMQQVMMKAEADMAHYRSELKILIKEKMECWFTPDEEEGEEGEGEEAK